jgi:hypothetical protein
MFSLSPFLVIQRCFIVVFPYMQIVCPDQIFTTSIAPFHSFYCLEALEISPEAAQSIPGNIPFHGDQANCGRNPTSGQHEAHANELPISVKPEGQVGSAFLPTPSVNSNRKILIRYT